MSVTDIDERRADLAGLAKRLGVGLIGFANLSIVDDPLTKKLPVAISLVMPMDAAFIHAADEPGFHQHQLCQRERLEAVKAQLGTFLTERGYRWHSVSNDTDQDHLTGELSHKMAAVSAGLGWIGKSSLFITPEYGPRVRLTTMLTDAPLATFSGYSESQCGACTMCVEACPVKAITGRKWSPDGTRADLIDAFLCNNYRIRLGTRLGRKHSCGHCMSVCPVGANHP